MFKKFIKSQKGQAIGFFPLVAIVLVVAIFFVYNLGNYFYTYMREQNAIDAAVFSGAAMQADALNGIISINRILLGIYVVEILVCVGSCLNPFCPCCACPAVINWIRTTSKIAETTLTAISKSAPVLSLAAMDIYKKSGGKASFPYYGIAVSNLKLDPVHFKISFAKYGIKLFMGLAEKERRGKYDWAGGKETKSEIAGSFGKRKGPNDPGGTYDRKGPYTIGFAVCNFRPVTSWFSKYERKIIVMAKARPYGGNVHTVGYKIKKFLFEFEANIPWGIANFKAKLVPILY